MGPQTLNLLAQPMNGTLNPKSMSPTQKMGPQTLNLLAQPMNGTLNPKSMSPTQKMVTNKFRNRNLHFSHVLYMESLLNESSSLSSWAGAK